MEQIITGVSAQKSPFHAQPRQPSQASCGHHVWAATSGSSSSRSQRSMRSACCSRPGTATGPWAHIAVVQGALAVVHEEIHAGLPQDGPAGSGRATRGTAKKSQYCWHWLKGRGQDDTRQ